MSKVMKHPSQAELKELFDYRDGELIWKNHYFKTLIGEVAGGIGKSGYRQIKISYRLYSAHRLICIFHNGDIPENLVVDHIDRNKLNNKIENLRLITQQENTFNRNDARGCYFNKNANKWQAQIGMNGKLISIGYFTNKAEAHSAYITAKKKYHIIKEHQK